MKGRRYVVVSPLARVRDTPTHSGAIVAYVANGHRLEGIEAGELTNGYRWLKSLFPVADVTGWYRDRFPRARTVVGYVWLGLLLEETDGR